MLSMEILARCGDQFVPVLVDDEDAARITGRLSISGTGYAQGWFDGRVETLHRWLLGLQPGDGMVGDHINGNKLDNRQANLRAVNRGMSSQNTKVPNPTGYRGVKRVPSGRFAARAHLGGVHQHLGTFDTAEQAAAAARAWREQHMPGYVNR